jgi:MoaA/NifB/PqqE/SkfB family radical SAM enzyme
MPRKTNKKINIVKNYLTGRMRFAEFAVTNVCVAKCPFCNIWKQQPKVFADRGKSVAAINRLTELGVSHITFTGGEALLHPDIIEFVETASKNGAHNAVLAADPRLLTDNDIPARLKAAGCDLATVSFDSDDPGVMAESRKIENIMGEMERAVEMTKKAGLTAAASVLIWKNNHDRLENVFAKAAGIGFDFITLNYPTFSDSPVYVLGGDGIDLPREAVISALRTAIALKKSKKFKIVNTMESMENIINFLSDPSKAEYPCFGGSRVMFVDWFLNIYPCMQLSTPLGNILEVCKKDLNIPGCNKCGMSWYRDFSMFFGGPRSIPTLVKALSESSGILQL